MLTSLLSVGLLVECAAGALTSPWFFIRNLQVSGLESLLPGEARLTLDAVRLDERTNIIAAPIGELKEQIQRNPWVAEAQIGRRLPGTLIVEIKPKPTHALLLTAGRHWDVDEAGFVIRRARRSIEKVVIAMDTSHRIKAGMQVTEEGISNALGLVKSLGRLQTPKVVKITVDRHAYMCLNMSDGIAIRLGCSDELETKLALVKKIYSMQPDLSEKVESIDLTAPEHPACLPRSETSRPKQRDSVSVHKSMARAVESKIGESSATLPESSQD
jgi:cell division septal protein FtsQ